LPAWTEGRGEGGKALAWVPQLLCEAYSVFVGGQLGQTAQLEELIEQHVLGCGAKLEAPQRALALLGFCASAGCQDGPAQGLELLLRRKRDANAALRRYLQIRLQRGAPLLDPKDAPGLALSTGEGDPGLEGADTAAAALKSLGRFSPTVEDRNARSENLFAHLRCMDACRDRALWTQLDHLSRPEAADRTADMESLLGEFDRLLRVHRLTELAPLFRRALLSTWLLPDQVPTLLEAGGMGSRRAASTSFSDDSRQIIVSISRFLPGAFVPHAKMIVQHLPDIESESSGAALHILGSLGKSLITDRGVMPELDRMQLFEVLLRTSSRLAQAKDAATCGSVCRKAVRAFAVLPRSESCEAVEQALQWVKGPRDHLRCNLLPHAWSDLQMGKQTTTQGCRAGGVRSGLPSPSRSCSPACRMCRRPTQLQWQFVQLWAQNGTSQRC